MTIAKRLIILLAVPLVALLGLGLFTRLQLADVEARSRLVAESRAAKPQASEIVRGSKDVRKIADLLQRVRIPPRNAARDRNRLVIPTALHALMLWRVRGF